MDRDRRREARQLARRDDRRLHREKFKDQIEGRLIAIAIFGILIVGLLAWTTFWHQSSHDFWSVIFARIMIAINWIYATNYAFEILFLAVVGIPILVISIYAAQGIFGELFGSDNRRSN